MKFKILRSTFMEGLKSVQNIVAGKGSLPILQNVLIEAREKEIRMTTTDLDISIRTVCECEVEEAGKTTLPVKLLFTAVTKVVEGEVEVVVDEKERASISAGNARYKLVGLPESEFPRLPNDENAFTYSLTKQTFREMLRKVSYAASQDDTRRTLKGVLLSFKNSKLTMVATDGRRLALVENEVEFPKDAEKDIVLPSKAVAELQRSMDSEGNLSLIVQKSQICFTLGSVTIYSKLMEDAYPNYKQVIPKETVEHITVDRQLLLDALDRGDLKKEAYELSQWRLMHIGAQPVPRSLIQHWKDYFPKHQYDTNYGLSESIGPGCVHLGLRNVRKVGAIGVPGYGWECKIVNGKRQEVKQGEVGELAVKGPGVMFCYYNDPKATKEVLDAEGWLYTGDMAKQDEEGFYYLVDRKKDVIISGGENIYPVQIEDFLHKQDDIKDVAVIGLPDKRLGEITAAIIEIKQGHTLTEDAVREFCMQLPRYKRPVKIIFADVPRNPTGKIEKPKLRKMYNADKIVEEENMA